MGQAAKSQEPEAIRVMTRHWKTGETGWIFGNEMSNVEFPEPMKVEIVGFCEGDLHPVKVRSQNGRIYYCREAEIQTRAAKAAKKPAPLIVPEKVKVKAEKMAEKRMEELQTAKKLPAFSEVLESFMALCKVGIERPESREMDIVMQLAERALFDRIKDGCVWEGSR